LNSDSLTNDNSGKNPVNKKKSAANLGGLAHANAHLDCQGQALRVLKKISTLRVVFFPKTLTPNPRPPYQELSLFFFFLFSFLF
jgi:hypothetical protein